jgi:hypothetical protein
MQRTTVTIGLWLGMAVLTTSGALAEEFCPSGDSFTRRKTGKGESLYWATRMVSMELNYGSIPNGITRDDFRAVVRKAQSTWSDVGCTNFEFDDQLQDAPSPDTNLTNESFDGSRCESKFGVATNEADCINRIVFRKSPNPDDPLYWPQDPSDPQWQKNCTQDDCRGNNPVGTLALTTTVFNEATGRIIDADMDINAVNYQWIVGDITVPPLGETISTADLQTVMTHELGHVLGFGHICNTLDSIMDPGYRWKQENLSEKHDENAICTTYPWDSITPESGTVILSGIEGGCSVVARAPVGFGWLLFAMAWLMWRRRARHAC